MAMVDFQGERLLAVSLLDICKDSLIYGSNDAGQTIHASDQKFNQLMDIVGECLNLKKHAVGDVEIVGPADIEGHKIGSEYFLLDFGIFLMRPTNQS